VILKRPLDDLMEKIGGEEFVNVRAWEPHRERLWNFDEHELKNYSTARTYVEVGNNAMFEPQ